MTTTQEKVDLALDPSNPEISTSPGLAAVLQWLDEREAYRLTSLAGGADSSKIGYPGWAAKMLRDFEARWVALSQGQEKLVLQMVSELTQEQSPGLRELLAWLDHEEGDYRVVNEHTIGAPLDGRHGRAAKLLRFFHANWFKLNEANKKLEAEVLRLRVLLGHMPEIHDIVEIACKDGVDVRMMLGEDVPLGPNVIEWRAFEVDQLWCVGLHDDPGFSVQGSRFIHTREGFLKTWRFLPEESDG